ncbi:hypothetical protein EC9_00760 [Rosistilla ulvae]|uniref:Uncharacterized protein n=1 Tax=Rosistilla ulvae TaxID=1930277 RepID=A0A517LTH1_9BACT|nr:hypothetical protein EC9_00760 [Rosistilla ulvae]
MQVHAQGTRHRPRRLRPGVASAGVIRRPPLRDDLRLPSAVPAGASFATEITEHTEEISHAPNPRWPLSSLWQKSQQQQPPNPDGIADGSRWFERSEYHRLPFTLSSAAPDGAHIDLRSLRDQRALGPRVPEGAAARRPPATICEHCRNVPLANIACFGIVANPTRSLRCLVRLCGFARNRPSAGRRLCRRRSAPLRRFARPRGSHRLSAAQTRR